MRPHDRLYQDSGQVDTDFQLYQLKYLRYSMGLHRIPFPSFITTRLAYVIIPTPQRNSRL
ncbi:hypothetical protein L218DRAFT_588853 [Marasmius fiardii PR-910]|nr:hypothetical protein L218DRAFT_588853 [Marasmius fiardii PR-910]